MKITTVFSLAVKALTDAGFKNINQLPGCAELQVDKSWRIAANGHHERIKDSSGVEVPPFSIYIEFNGCPAGFVDAGGGHMAAGAIANEEALIAALEARKQAA
jgi:hypothetical protein